MKKLAILTSVLALAACGGGAGGGAGFTGWSNDTVITNDMLSSTRSAQSQEIQKKLETIRYVEDNLGSLINEDHELTGNTSRSATNNKMGTGLTLANIERRYQEALHYFDVLKKVMTADSQTQVTNKEVAIAYSLSKGQSYDDPETQNQLTDWGITVTQENETTTVNVDLLVATITVTITNNCEENDTLKNTVTQDVINEIPILEPEPQQDDTEQEPNKPFDPGHPQEPSIDETRFTNVKYTIADDFDTKVSFNIDENGKIKTISLTDDEVGTFTRDGDIYNFNFRNTGSSFLVQRTYPVYHTEIATNLGDPKDKNSEAFAKIAENLEHDMQQNYCWGSCPGRATSMLAAGTYTVTQKNDPGKGDYYYIEFPVSDEWGDAFLSPEYVANNLKTIKGQQLHYLVHRHIISEDEAAEYMADNDITNMLNVKDEEDKGICYNHDAECEPTLQAIVNGDVRFSDAGFDATLDIELTPTLSYASFGSFKSKITTTDEVFNMITLFAGGDEDHKIAEAGEEKELISGNPTFYGKAIGVAFRENPDGEETIASEKFVTNNATLELNTTNKSERLYMPFGTDGNNYYDVTVFQGKNVNDGKVSFTFDNPTEKVIQEGFQISGRDNHEASMHTMYYGDNKELKIPTEVSGVVRYDEWDENDDFVGFEGAFGLKKQEIVQP